MPSVTGFVTERPVTARSASSGTFETESCPDPASSFFVLATLGLGFGLGFVLGFGLVLDLDVFLAIASVPLPRTKSGSRARHLSTMEWLRAR